MTDVHKLPTLRKIPVYEVRLVQTRRPLWVAEAAVSRPEHAARTLHALFGLSDREHFATLFFDGAHNVTGIHVVAIGSQHSVGGLDPRVVFRAAIAAHASAIIIGHNHPSGNPEPSRPDLAITTALTAAGKLLDVPILDHIIVTRDATRWYSMAEHGMLPQA